MVGDGRDLARCGQHLIEMPLPSRGIGTGWPVAAHDGPVDNLLNPAAGPISGDRFAGPVRLEPSRTMLNQRERSIGRVMHRRWTCEDTKATPTSLTL
jgi:hypothetical protein